MDDEGDKTTRRKKKRKKKEQEGDDQLTSILRLPLEVNSHQPIEDSETLVSILKPHIGEPMQEVLLSICLDSRRKITGALIVSLGTLSACLTHPREIFRDAIKRSAATIIIVHCHPSGDPAPSEEDHILTQRIADVGDIIGIPVLDHIIMGKDSHWSYAVQASSGLRGIKWML